MYQYSDAQKQVLQQRAKQFGQQVQRFKSGEIHPDFFQQLRLRNGLYKQRYAHMLRVAIPYGTLCSQQLRKLAFIARKYDRGYGHFTTRQNIQYNWPALEAVSTILSDLAEVGMHAIQTSGSCIRNITTDHFAGVAADEVEDPRAWCELLRQWSVFHPEFNWLPRKFKFAVSAAATDRAVTELHDIGLKLYHDQHGNSVFKVLVGGGMGRTPVIGKVIHPALPGAQLLAYMQSILRIYNLYGRRDNKYKSRIKILVNDLGIDQFRNLVEQDFARADPAQFADSLQQLAQFKQMFAPKPATNNLSRVENIAVNSPIYAEWVKRNTVIHKLSGYCIVIVSLKKPGEAPGDMQAEQMQIVADIAEKFGEDEIRVSHEQNLILPMIRKQHLFEVFQKLTQYGLATANIGTIGDLICCPGIDFCSLANASTIPVVHELNQSLAKFKSLPAVGELKLKISGCMNACGHHHIGDIGILGVDKKGEEWYQITLGGKAGNGAALGLRLGPAISRDNIIAAIEMILDTYLKYREADESFNTTTHRIGVEPFKNNVYQNNLSTPRAA